ncbi:PRE_C2HC domain-containing protein [Trichonephila clavipes]|nr:PRE_C2HC domain-containing protein [Trichonephila clavipes]
MDMATDTATNMECQNIPLPTSRPTTPDLFTPCQRLIQVQTDIKKFSLLVLGAQNSLNSLAPFMSVDDPEVTELFQRHKFYQEELQRSECEYGTLSPCTTSGCTVHGTPPASPSKTIEEYPALPKIKVNTNKHRPIKVVIKGLHRDRKIEDIQNEILEQGFPNTEVTQLTGRITKQKLPIFMVKLPRNINNAKSFDLKTLSYFSIRVDGYDGKGVMQCYFCNRFNHTAERENCHMTPHCIKCGQAHEAKDCTIQRVDNTFCINCQAYGHMANYFKCPLYPKPRKSTSTKNNYTSVVESIVRPNLSYAQATPPAHKPITTKTLNRWHHEAQKFLQYPSKFKPIATLKSSLLR